LLGKFKEHARIGNFLFELFLSLDSSLDATALLQQFLRGFLIGPEIWRRRLAFDLF